MTPRKPQHDGGCSPSKRQRYGTSADPVFDGSKTAAQQSPKRILHGSTSAAQRLPDRKPDTTVPSLTAAPHDPFRGDRHFCAGASHRALEGAFQTTNLDSSSLFALLHKLVDVKDMLQDWVTDNGLQAGDQVLYEEGNGTFAPAVVTGPAVTGVLGSKSSYLIRRAHDTKCFEALADRLSLIGREQIIV